MITNQLESKAFCNWKSSQLRKPIRLLSEEEWKVIRELGENGSVDQPDWDIGPGNINLEHFASECPIDMFEWGSTRFYDVIGNVWQWTETPIDGFPGFEGLDTANTLIPLEIDNRISKAVITYNNISNPLFNIRNEDSNPEGFYSYPIAIGGQQIQISVKMNIPIKGTMQPVDSNEDNDFSDLEDIPSVPSLSFFYNNANSGVGSSIIHQGYDSVSTDSLTWYYSLMVADGDNNDGDLDLIFTAKDRSGNDVEMFENTDILKVDNIHPQAFQTGNVVIYGLNPVQGWISGNTDSIEVKVPIVGPASDTSLYAGSSTPSGRVDIQMFNTVLGTDWVSIFSDNVSAGDLIVFPGDSVSHFRTINNILSALPDGTDLIMGNSLQVRGVITDKHGNVTFGSISYLNSGADRLLVYDPLSPETGSANLALKSSSSVTSASS